MKKEDNLSIKEYELLKQLLLVTSSIQKLYCDLYKLEISNMKNSDEYRKKMDYLNMCIQVEDEMYEQIDKNLAKKINEKLYDFFSEQDSEIVKRISYILINRFTFDENSAIELLPHEIIDSFIDSNLNELDTELKQFILASIEVCKILKNEILLSFLIFLEEFICDNKWEKFKNTLISFKYKLSFSNRNIEMNLLNDNFNIPDVVCINSSVLSAICKIKDREYSFLKESYCMNKVFECIYNIIKKNDDDYSEKDNQIKAILNQCFIRAYFLLMSEENIEDANYDFHKVIESSEYRDEHYDDKIGENMVIKCFQKVNKDRNKKIVLKMPS